MVVLGQGAKAGLRPVAAGGLLWAGVGVPKDSGVVEGAPNFAIPLKEEAVVPQCPPQLGALVRRHLCAGEHLAASRQLMLGLL